MISMHSGLRKILVVILGLCVATVGVAWQSAVGFWLTRQLSLRPEFLGGFPNTIYRFGDEYTQLSYLILCLAAGLSFVAIVWDKSVASRAGAIALAISFTLLLPVASIKLLSGSLYVIRWKHVLVDIVVVLLGLVSAFILTRMQPISSVARLLQSVTLFLLLATAVFTPAAYAILWSVKWRDAIQYAQTFSFMPSWITLIAVVCSLAIVIPFHLHLRAEQSFPKEYH